jgi:RNA polymerase sigma factor (sigma-70 family)
MPPSKRQLAAQRRQETIAYLWSCYDKDRGNVELRNRLAEHYTPLVQEIAQRYVRRYGLREAQTAIADALLLLVVQLVPRYDGQRDFARWAMLCIRRKMLERARLESEHCEHFATNLGDEEDWPEIEAMLVRPNEPHGDVRFAELTAAVPARDAALLWLRFHRHLAHHEIAAALGICEKTVARQIRRAIGVLQKLAAPPTQDLST